MTSFHQDTYKNPHITVHEQITGCSLWFSLPRTICTTVAALSKVPDNDEDNVFVERRGPNQIWEEGDVGFSSIFHTVCLPKSFERI